MPTGTINNLEMNDMRKTEVTYSATNLTILPGPSMET